MPVVKLRISSRITVEVEPSPRADELLAAVRVLCVHKNPDHAAWRAFRARTKRGRFMEPPQTIETFRDLGPQMVSVPVGRLAGVVLAASLHGFKVEKVADDRVLAPIEVTWRGPELWEHQRWLVRKTAADFRSHDTGTRIWRSPAGSGKTIAALALVAEMRERTLVVAPSNPIITQWVKACCSFLGFEPAVLKGAQRTMLTSVTIATQQAAATRADDLSGVFGMIVADEIQNHASATCQVFADASRAAFRLGVSQDERRADGRQFLIYDQFGDVVESVDEGELVGQGVVVPVDVVVVPTRFRASWYTALSSEARFKARSTLITMIAEDEERNAQIAGVLKGAAANHEKVLTIVQRVAHAQRLSGMCQPSVLLLGKKEGMKAGDFDRNVAMFADDRVRFAFGTEKSVGVGFESHRGLARVMLAAPFVAGKTSEMQFKQFIKRASRSSPGKDRGIAYYMLDVEVFGTKPLELIKRWVPSTMVVAGPRLISPDEYMDRRD